ncbi:NADH:flavorubredoxin reductase NorW (plasmid) [Photobacterium sp. DA100]|uniref:NADH:flavorubredoxin reductase NorW n=1 Tax=Photobacterium sp. DA100 TaxID=3027472 RepID=UPI002478E5C8|nr:NADH:flavorubredoxin reductase NorW [Photobacterium sp. DA100]WEM45922.1 NADH:flavorubredoxin reductase NorW [Photobacterium sp. DA100]
MEHPITIIGSGFAAYQLVKAIRRQDKHVPIRVFTSDEGHDYNKPDLSHASSNQQTASDLIRMSGTDFAAEHQVELYAHSTVEVVETKHKYIVAGGQCYDYGKLVFATGASAFIPPVSGDASGKVVTLNSLAEYRAAQDILQRASHIAVIGAGLIGTELAMDFACSGKTVSVVDPCQTLMANQLPDYIAMKLERVMVTQGTRFFLADTVERLSTLPGSRVAVELASGREIEVDVVVSAAGLKPNIQIAKNAGMSVNKGIVVDTQLQTSAPDVYAIGDCAEINGKVLAYLQPALLSANALAKTLLGQPTSLVLPAMMVKVKTPAFPIQFAGQNIPEDRSEALSWQIDVNQAGSTLKTRDQSGQLTGYVVTQQHLPSAFSLLKELNSK